MTAHPLRPLLTALVLLTGVSVGCSSGVLPGRDPATAQDVAELKRRVLELQRQATRSEIELDRLRARVVELEAELRASGGSRPLRPSTSPPTPPPEELPSPAHDSPQPVLEEVDLPDEPTPSPPAADREATPVSAAGQAVYDRGYALYHQGRYLDAESTFQRFLAEHGSTDLADNARYWIGEARHARGDVPGALAAFRETVERHPTGNKVPDALLKAGQALDELGDRESSREMYRELIRRYPQSDAASVAERRLRSMP